MKSIFKKCFIMLFLFVSAFSFVACDSEVSFQLSDLFQQNETQSQAILDQQQQITDLQAAIDDLENLLEEQGLLIESQSQDIQDLGTLLANLQSAVADIQELLASQSTQIAAQLISINAQAAVILDISEQGNAAEADINALEIALSAVESDIDVQGALIASLESLYETIDLDVAANLVSIGVIESQLTSIELTIDSLQALAATLGETDTTLQSSIDALGETDTTLQSSIDTLGAADSTLQSTIDALEVQLTQTSSILSTIQVALYTDLTFFQVEESLVGTLEFSELVTNTPDGFVYAGSNIVVNHPLKISAGVAQYVSTVTSDAIQTEATINVQYHGNYSLSVTLNYVKASEQKNYSFTLDECQYTASHYNLAWLNATMPALLFATDMLTGEYSDGYTYVELERARTYDFTKLPTNTSGFPAYASASKGNYNQSSVANFYEPVDPRTGKAYIIDWMNELYSMDNGSTFTFATVDNAGPTLTGMFMTDIPQSNMNYKIYTDGSYTSFMINLSFTTQGYYSYFTSEYATWKQNKINGTDLTSTYSTPFSLVAAEDDNFEYIVNNTSSWILASETWTAIAASNIRAISVANAFASVIAVGKLNNLEYLLKTRWGDLPEQSMSSYFSGTPVDNLLILGTSPASEANASYATFDKYIQYVLTTYGSSYKIFYKGHPSYPSSDARKAMFAANNIIELPNTIPVESLMLLYENVYVGGYTSTSFQSSKENQTLFFFGPESVIRGNATIASMLDAGIIFANTDFLIKDINGDVIVE